MSLAQVVQVTNPTGLHARPAARFVELARSFECDIQVEVGDRRANAKSMISLLRLGVSGGAVITLSADGPDERPAIDAIVALLAALEDEPAGGEAT